MDDTDSYLCVIPTQRTRATVLAELRDTQRRRMHIRADWDEHLRQIDACRLQHKLAVDAIELLNAELARTETTP